ncbi:hypothetical protein GCM10027043_18110 [Ferruginibacter profundus]
MTAIEALKEQCKVCEPCILNAQIIEFEQLPEDEKFNFDWYEKDKHYLIHCLKCSVYNILPCPVKTE